MIVNISQKDKIMVQREKLFSEFNVPSRQDWLDKIEVDLKGADFQKKLVWRTNEGFNVQPFYRREDLDGNPAVDSLPGEFPFIRGNKRDNNLWYVRQNIVVDDASTANAKALDILNKGVDSLGFYLSPEQVDGSTLKTLLKDIRCDIVEINFCTCKRRSFDLAKLLVDYFDSQGYDKSKVCGSIDWDPIEKVLMKGKDIRPLLSQASELSSSALLSSSFVMKPSSTRQLGMCVCLFT